MTWTNCTIILNSDSTGSFYTGDIVTGNIVLELKKDQKIQRIDFKVVGICKAQWSRSSPTIPYIKIYSEKRKVLSITISDIFKEILHGNTIRAGVYQYPFHFALPSDLPSTFESSIAKTTYYIKVKSKPAYKLRKIVNFNVLGNINLNHVDDMLMPCFHEFKKEFRNSGTFGLSIRTYQAFAPKQTVPFEVTINNEKKVRIYKINITLIQKIRYTVSSGYADEERKMCKVEHKKFSHNIAEICYIHMEIPQIIPSSLNIREPMIDISYIFRIEVIFPFHFTLQKEIPVTVSTAPVIHSEF
ncbi:arrestin domain-containing protein 2-like [Anticarsia gemmatalis]|uniref:arrestin domain-containing protein 2-like n=1 Tax=Anticarsia gemmatalis TaxID=129554 RepID=UPI003F766201